MMAINFKSQLLPNESIRIQTILDLVTQPFILYKSLTSENLSDYSQPQKDVL